MAYSGIITSFGNEKGYGFITSDQVSGDIFFNRSVLPDELKTCSGILHLKEMNVQLDLQPKETWKNGKPVASRVMFLAAEGAKCFGSVKRFNPQKGFGFIGTSSMPEQDFFFGSKDIPKQLHGAELKGQAVCFKVVTSPDGKLQAHELVFPSLQSAAGPAQQHPIVSAMPMQLHQMQMQQPMVQKGAGQQQRMQGVVKRYNDASGFGFASCPFIDGDIYFKGQGTPFAPGSPISFRLQIMPDGAVQAREVAPGYDTSQMQTGMPQMLGQLFGQVKGKGACKGNGKGASGEDVGGYVGTVASYNPAKGFGFFKVQGMQDVFFKKDFVPGPLQETDLSGKTAQLVLRFLPDGKVQASDINFVATAGMQGGAKRPMQGSTQAAKRPRGDIYEGGGPFSGTITSFNPKKGFGFIQSDAAPSDVFFSSKILSPGLANIDHTGKSVTFHLNYTAEGKPQASKLDIF
eukprot:TRINITY_DN65121_c0_g1_i1.p1 TRINITY_DN65121_c0_g1~~TRINITY_DN65121_c0_g1_i1.p1  ORF type:complete len:486 (-),score=103.86 TRINITY_DN65121_c0_g1_i1:37-1416(-)